MCVNCILNCSSPAELVMDHPGFHDTDEVYRARGDAGWELLRWKRLVGEAIGFTHKQVQKLQFGLLEKLERLLRDIISKLAKNRVTEEDAEKAVCEDVWCHQRDPRSRWLLQIWAVWRLHRENMEALANKVADTIWLVEESKTRARSLTKEERKAVLDYRFTTVGIEV